RHAFLSFVTNHNHITRCDDAFLDSGEGRVFAVEDTCGTTEILQIVAGNLDDASLRGEVSLQDHQTASGLERRAELANNFLPRCCFCRGSFFAERTAGVVEVFAAEEPGFRKALCDRLSAAREEGREPAHQRDDPLRPFQNPWRERSRGPWARFRGIHRPAPWCSR